MSAIPPSATLSGRINTATRKQHTELNRLLINRLPLALPPNVTTPLLYAKGIVPFARIFVLFEIEWELLTRHVQSKSTAGQTQHDLNIRQWLANLRPQGLARSHRLKNDLQHLRLVGGRNIYSTPELGEKWMKEMRDLMRQKPHVFVAFAWVFYMAVFSGGRWIRQQMAHAGPGFWGAQAQPAPLSIPASEKSATMDEDGDQIVTPDVHGYSFLSFNGDNDGEDLKALFKTRLALAEELLTPGEQQDIIEVAQALFDKSILLVNQLDSKVRRGMLLSRTTRLALPAVLFVLLLLALLQVPSLLRLV
ncbi:hypothetical protein DOTSEDRAFT_69894 [Dothistroma septosporum NZE10]|uniref:Heme oxygenase-like protein n=1 Tax=Dothistroma septosporum (strain NZE10 / CBS 128990) TaxID=675120 RepID=N1PXH8_DOTSN|nr:hypothetical protein DOTSEDRAFT_69894 [Dothistroma septosporum NZE10]